MTICIAGYSRSGETIICATDMKSSLADLSLSADNVTIKIATFGKRWLGLMANDYSSYPNIRRRASDYIRDKLKIETHDLRMHQLAEALQHAFQAESQSCAEAEILAPYGLTFDNYRDEGPKLGPDTYSRIIFELKEYSAGLSLLITGFSTDSGLGGMFTIDGKGAPKYLHGVGAWAIGSGDLAALGYLFSNETSQLNDEETMFYRICCAKFAAETSPGVGRKTLVVALKPTGTRKVFADDDILAIRRDWEKSRHLRLSLKQHELAKDIISSVADADPPPSSSSKTSEDKK